MTRKQKEKELAGVRRSIALFQKLADKYGSRFNQLGYDVYWKRLCELKQKERELVAQLYL